MKKIICCACILIIITGSIIIYFHKYYPDNIMEICIGEYISPQTINDAIDETGVYDFVIVYDLFSEEENAKVYTGNINILINNKSKDNLNLLLNNNEVIMGDKFAKKNYTYYPLGEKHITKFGEYKINAIVSNCSDIYYSDLSILKNSNIKNQRLYAVLKDKDNNYIDENTFISQIGSRGISMASTIRYGNVENLLIKILILLIITIVIIILFNLCKKIKKSVVELMKRYKEVKYDFNFRQFVFQTNSLKEIRNIAVCMISSILLIILIMFLTVKYVDLRMPYKLNPVSPKSIYDVILLFINLVKYYIKNGMTEISILILLLAVLYFIVIAVLLISLVLDSGKNKKNYLLNRWRSNKSVTKWF